MLECRLEAGDETGKAGVVFAENGDHLLGLHRLRERSESAQVAENGCDLAAMRVQEPRFTARDHGLDDLGREEALQAPDALQLVDLRGDALLERLVPGS